MALGIRDNSGSLRPVFFSEECSKPLRRSSPRKNHRRENYSREWREKFEQCHEQFADDVSLRKRGLGRVDKDHNICGNLTRVRAQLHGPGVLGVSFIKA